MTKKRFEYGEGDKGPLIYDNTGVDDYYFLNDSEEMDKFIDLINSIETEWKEDYNHVMGEYKKQLIQINEKDLEISKLKKENHKLQQALLWCFDITVFEYSSTYDKDMEHGCKILFGCSHDEAEEKYGGFEKTETYRELQKE